MEEIKTYELVKASVDNYLKSHEAFVSLSKAHNYEEATKVLNGKCLLILKKLPANISEIVEINVGGGSS